MKKIATILLSLSIAFAMAQNNEINTKPDSLSNKYLGLNIGSLITNITQGLNTSSNYSIKYRVEKANNLLFQSSLNLKLEQLIKERFYNFTDSLNNDHERTYTKLISQFDFRIGYGIYEKLGYGNIYLVGNLLVGYTNLYQSYDDVVKYINNGNVEGIGFVLIDYARAGYFTAGVDLSIGYEINLGKRITLGLEYSPELSFNTLVNSYYFGNTSSFKFNDNIINSYFNVFNINLLYKF